MYQSSAPQRKIDGTQMEDDVHKEFLEWAKTNYPPSHSAPIQGIRRAILLTHWHDISVLLCEGFSKRKILEFLSQKKGLDCSYPVFLRFCEKQLANNYNLKPADEVNNKPITKKTERKHNHSVTKPPASQPSQTQEKRVFSFNPIPDPSIAESVENE